AAEREADEAVVEGHSLVGEQPLRLREHTHLLDRLVVGLDHDDIGTVVRNAGRPRLRELGRPRAAPVEDAAREDAYSRGDQHSRRTESEPPVQFPDSASRTCCSRAESTCPTCWLTIGCNT